MAPVSGPLTQGVAGTQPSARATLMSRNRAVCCRTFSASGDESPVSSAVAAAAGSDRTAIAMSVDSVDGLDERCIFGSPCAARAAVNYRRKVIVATPGGIGAYTQSSCQLSPYLSSPASDFPRGGSGS